MLTYIKRKKLTIGALVVVALAIYAVKFRHSPENPESASVLVEVATVTQLSMPSEVHALGTLSARSIDITAESSGRINKINFKDGAQVKQGDILLKLEDAVLSAKYASSKADYEYIEGNYNRMVPLGKRGFVAKDTLEKAAAELKRKKAEMEENAVMLDHARLIAPFEGATGKCKVSEGEYVNSGQSIVTLTDTKHLKVEYNLPEKYLPQLKMGQEVKVSSAAYPGKLFTGKVLFISPTIDTENRTINLYAEVPNEENALAAGMLVDVTQILGGDELTLTIPARSLVPVLDGQQVFKIVDGKATAINVVVGKRRENEVQITQGLTVGDKVITDGQLKVRNNTPVKVKT